MIKDVFLGVFAYARSISMISKLNLWRYFLVPIIISFVFGLGLLSLSYSFSDDFSNYLSGVWSWEMGSSYFNSFTRVISFISINILGFILFKHIVLILSSPFMSKVSEKIEKYQLGDNTVLLSSQNTFISQLIRALRLNSRNLIKELFITLLLLLLSFIPFVNIFSTFLLFMVQAYYAGFGCMDYTLERHFNYRDSVLFVKKNKGIAIGNGIIFMLLYFIPFIGVILVLPLAVTAASIGVVEKINTSKIHG